MTSVLAPRSFARPGRWRERRRDSRQRPHRYAGGVGEQLPACRAPWPFRGSGDPGGRCIRCFGAECAAPFGLGGYPDSVLEDSSREGPRLSGGDVGQLQFGRDVRSCRQLCGAWRASSVDSVREARGHERAAAVVHPIKASPRAQDREDRKRSRREYSTNTVLGSRVAHSEVRANAMRGS
jgi:hypothetical protein